MWKEILSGLAQMNTAAYQNMKTASFDAVFKNCLVMTHGIIII